MVWDVDPLAKTIALYRAEGPTQPVIHVQGQLADAEPAVPGWRLAVNEVFP